MTDPIEMPAPSARWELRFPPDRYINVTEALKLPSGDGTYQAQIWYRKAVGTYLGAGGFWLRIRPDRNIECSSGWNPIIEGELILGFVKEGPK